MLDGVSGFLAGSARGWFEALEQLADAPALRTRMSDELRTRLDAAYDRQVDDLIAFLSGPPRGAPPSFAGERSAEDDLADLAGYASPPRVPSVTHTRRGSSASFHARR